MECTALASSAYPPLVDPRESRESRALWVPELGLDSRSIYQPSLDSRMRREEEGGGSFLFGKYSCTRAPDPGPAVKAHRGGAPTPGVERPLASTLWGNKVVLGGPAGPCLLPPPCPRRTRRPHPRDAREKFRREGESARRPRPHHGPAADNGGAESAGRPGEPHEGSLPPIPPFPARPAYGTRSGVPGCG